MKANKAPEKIWMSDDTEAIWVTNPCSTRFIEYTRTDAFIEKACEWLKSKGGFTIGFDGATVRDFLEFINK